MSSFANRITNASEKLPRICAPMSCQETWDISPNRRQVLTAMLSFEVTM